MTVHVIQSDFEIGEHIKKVSGDYTLTGVVVGVVEAFPGRENSPIRYIVRHMAEGGGWFLHIYNRSQLKSIDRTVTRKPRMGEPGWSTATDAPPGVEG